MMQGDRALKKLLDMTPERAKKYFMKNSSYFGLELPKYFYFIIYKIKFKS